MIDQTFRTNVEAQIQLLLDGKPLEAFDQFFAAEGVMYANDELFAANAVEGHNKQAPFMTKATAIHGAIRDLKLLPDEQVCVFRNHTAFETADGQKHKINGLCWQKWQDGKIVEERYFDGSAMDKLVKDGILEAPNLLEPLGAHK